MNLGHHHSEETKIAIGAVMARAWHRHTSEEDELCYSTRYINALAKIRALEAEIDSLRKLNSRWVPGSDGIPVKTCGECLPAAGDMLWSGGGFALVWFHGCDRPAVWPSGDLEVVGGGVKENI